MRMCGCGMVVMCDGVLELGVFCVGGVVTVF